MTFTSRSLPVCIANCAEAVVEVRLTGGFCVVAFTVACLDILSDFLALRRRLGADRAVARQRCSGGGSTGFPTRGWRDAISKRCGADGAAIG